MEKQIGRTKHGCYIVVQDSNKLSTLVADTNWTTASWKLQWLALNV